ncbi:carboxypeptidase regulatory-like domain-containing protein [Gammaproteobacteria bacterium]|nr:carboxypeptidase regulatory-like domain-containing protein [Gammaproteobacteria bacterium]
MFSKYFKSLAIFTVAISASFISADDTGALNIKVVDSSGNAVVGAVVSAKTSESLRSASGATNSDGTVKLSFLDPSSKYVVNVKASGFASSSATNITVVSGQTRGLSLVVASVTADMDELVVVASREALIDTTSAQQGLDITLALTESLPTGRNYQSYLQLAPSVKPSNTGNPSSKSGVNYRDAFGQTGRSTDNVYYIDGVNVTNVDNGLANSNLNSEIIQEQQVLTGGLSAEYEGGTGLVSKVITKSGGNEFTGSINYYFQNDSLVADNDNLPNNTYNKFDTAVTLGGPIIKDKLWFFASMQTKETEIDVSDLDAGTVLRTSTASSDLGFGKLTAQITDNDFLSFSYFDDPYDQDATTSATTLNNRDSASAQGGSNTNLTWTHSFDKGVLTVSKSSHEGESSTLAANSDTRNDVAYTDTAEATLAARNKGGSGSNSINFSNKDELSVTYDFNINNHEIKVGYLKTENERLENLVYTGDSAQYTSIGTSDIGTSYADYLNTTWNGVTDVSDDDEARVLTAGNAIASFVTAYDTDASGAVDAAELAAATYNSTSGNPTGDVNVYRILQVQKAPLTLRSEGQAMFIQDTIYHGQWTFDVGFRAESYEHFGSDGSKIADFDWEIAPRMSVTYDINGDGRSKLYVYDGRYYDPIRTDMTGFAGTLNGSVREEQIYLADQWITYRTRGGAQEQDAYFSPNTKTPYTDELILGYSQLIGEDKSISVTYTDRKTKDIMEDFGAYVYSCGGPEGAVTPAGCPSYGYDAADGGDGILNTDFGLPLSYFGWDAYPNSNYIIGTLAGGHRNYTGLEIAFRKRPTDDKPYSILASYTNNQAEGNSNSDGNADLQGDFDWLDPRAPNMYGPQSGNMEHQLKFAGTYQITEKLEAGMVFNWNSGYLFTKGKSVYRRNVPAQGEAYEVGGLSRNWIENQFGTEQAPSYYELDLRLKYTTNVMSDRELEVFVDVFNVLDNQAVIEVMPFVDGDGVYNFGEGNDWVSPRSFYLGARLSF